MAYRFSAAKLVSVALVSSMTLSACVSLPTIGIPSVRVVRGTSTPEEAELQRRARALQRTIIEGATAGAAAGFAIDRLNGGNNPWRSIAIGAAVGAIAGSYVASLQRSFADRESRLKQARADIRATIAETKDTLKVMRIVQRHDVAEIRTLRAALAAGRTDQASLSARIRVARANLADMQGAISGAQNRAQEFTKARAVLAEQDGSGNIDRELAELQNRIAQMRAIAEDLSQNM